MAEKRPLISYTTEIAAAQTAGEITGLLAAAGARRVSLVYSAGAQPEGIEFSLDTHAGLIDFRIPVNIDPVQKVLFAHYEQRRGGVSAKHTEPTHAAKVAWRITKRWIEDQLAMIETGMAKSEQVFLAFALDANDRPLYEVFVERRLALPKG